MVTSLKNESRERPWALINLPPFPAVAMRVLKLLAREDMGLKELSQQIQADPALASEILALANSALFGFRTEIRSILQATTLLGAQRVKGIALTVAMKTYLAESFQIPALLACWQHSLACALLAEELAKVSLIESDFAYLAGLLHDVGRLALGMIKPMEYANLLSERHKSHADVFAREKELFGIDHCQAGRWLAESWKLPKPFIDVISKHHNAVDGKFDILALVNRSCLLADALGFATVSVASARKFEEIVLSLPERERRRFNPDPQQLAMSVAIKIHELE